MKSKSVQISICCLCFTFLLLGCLGCGSLTNPDNQKRFFSNNSFWNQPLPENPEIDPRSDEWIELLKLEPSIDHFAFNNTAWTIPVYEVDSNTPVYNIKRRKLDENEKKFRLSKREYYGFGSGFGRDVPIPDYVRPDPEEDSHFAVVDWERKLAWDMWGAKKLTDGSWASFTGMKYRLDGDGIFHAESYEGILDDESVHFHGPSRAAGVPAIAGLIMHDEVIAGKIKHKLAFAIRFAAFQEFVYPASWCDGIVLGGIPEGAILQLDPGLDLGQFHLSPGELVVARALQEYGMVLVDMAEGPPIYAEGLWDHPDKSWKGVLPRQAEGLKEIKFDYFRILKVGTTVKKGDISVVRRGKPLVPDFVDSINKVRTFRFAMPGYTRGELIQSEDFSKGFDHWMPEGKVAARIYDGCLLFESKNKQTENPKGNIWWRVDVNNPFVLEFDYKSLTEYGLSMVFWNATGLDGRDVFSWKRTGRYEEYINGMRAYHVSFHRFGSGKSNIRKAPGFHLVSSVLDPITPNDTLWHRIAIASAGNRQRIYVDGRLIHDFTDEGKPCLNDKSWQHPLPCKGTGGVPNHGAVSIRHTQKQKALYDNFKIYNLNKE